MSPVSVAQVWTHSLFFTFSELNFFLKLAMWTHWGRLQPIFPPETQFFCNLFEFPTKNPLKIQHLPHLSSEINSIKLDSLRAFQQFTENTSQFQYIVSSVLIWFSFHQENGSIFNSFHTVAAPNSLKPSRCITPYTHRELSKDTKSATWSAMVWEMSSWQNKTKQNTTLLLHHRLTFILFF